MTFTPQQKMLIDLQSQWPPLFNKFVFVLDRRSGKTVMGMEMVVNEIRRLRSGSVPPRNGRGISIAYMFFSEERARWGRNILRDTIEPIFPIETKDHIKIEGIDSDGEPFPVSVYAESMKSNMFIGLDISLKVIDEMAGPLDWLQPNERAVAFRSVYDPDDRKPGVIIIDAQRQDILPSSLI